VGHTTTPDAQTLPRGIATIMTRDIQFFGKPIVFPDLDPAPFREQNACPSQENVRLSNEAAK
jgi:hypothetical protein